MARAITTYPFENLSGRLGNGVWQNFPDGPRVRAYVYTRSPQTPLQIGSQDRTRLVSRTWALLDAERVARWRAFAGNPTFSKTGRRPRGSGPGRAYSLYFKLASQAVRIDPARDLRTFDPPTRPFTGDAMRVTLSTPSPTVPPSGRASLQGEPSPEPITSSAILFCADRANAPGVVTELRTQKLRHGHCLPSPEKYRFAAFHAFAAGETLAVPMPMPMPRGVYACAYAFYDAETGQQTDLVEIGVATVG